MLKNSYIYKNLIPVILLNISGVAIAFVVPVLVMQTYGVEMHGLVSTITSLMSYLMLVEMGITAASIKGLYGPLAEKNRYDINSILNAVEIYFKRIGILFSFLLIFTALLFPLLVSSEIKYYLLFLLILTMGSSQIVEFIYFSKYKVLLQADQKFYVLNWINLVGNVLQALIRVILILNNQEILLVYLVPALVYVLRVFLIYIYVKKHYPFLDGKIEPSFSSITQKGAVMVHQLTNLIVNNTDVIIISLIIGFNSVSIYSVYVLVINTINLFLSQALGQPLTSKIGHMLSQGNIDRVKRFVQKFEWRYYFLITIIYSTLAFALVPFVGLYTKNIEDVIFKDFYLGTLFLIIGLLSNFRVPQLVLITAKGDFLKTRNHAILEATLNISFSLILIQFIGLYGVLLGTVISYAYRSTIMIFYANKNVLNVSTVLTFKKISLSLITITIMVLISLTYNLNNEINDWFELIIKSIAFMILSVITHFFVNYFFDRHNLLENSRRLRMKVTNEL